MSYAQAAKTLIKIGATQAQRAGAFVSGKSFIYRNVPPPYRGPALRIFRAFEQAATGAGIYSIYDELSNGFQSGIPQRPKRSNQQYKKYSRNFKYSRGQYKYQNSTSRCRCRKRYEGKSFYRR